MAADEKTTKDSENYSRDADQTRFIYISGLLAGFTLLGLFSIEIITLFIKNPEKPFLLTPEIVHTLIPVTVGGMGLVGGWIFGARGGGTEGDGEDEWEEYILMETNDLRNQDWFQRILKSEGGMNWDEPASCGGKSYAGITQKTYTEWRKNRCIFVDAPVEVEGLAGDALDTEWEKRSPLEIPEELGVRVDVICAFYTDYFKKAYIELLPECLRYMHADFFVNAMYNANKILQRMCGVDDDGILGMGSRAALSSLTKKLQTDIEVDPTADDDLIMAYHNEKLAHYQGLVDKNPDKFGKWHASWKKRAQHILSELGDYFHDENPTPSAVLDDEVHDGLFDDDVVAISDPPENKPNDRQSIVDQIAALLQKLV